MHATPRLFVVIPTHMTRHLELCLASFARQKQAPDGVVLTCDNDDESIGELASSVWSLVHAVNKVPLSVVQRPFTGRPSLNQVRNNGLRALDARFRLDDDDLIVLLDGDTLLDDSALEIHAREHSAGADLIIPYRVNLTPEQTELIDLPRVLDHNAPALSSLIRPDQMQALRDRDKRYRRQLRQRRSLAGRLLVKPHKPKVLGGHHAVRVGPLRMINGYDEAYVDYGYDDDDLARRLHTRHPRVSIAVSECFALHLWHPSRAPSSPVNAPGYLRFRTKGLPARAEHGWDAPARQGEVVVNEIN